VLLETVTGSQFVAVCGFVFFLVRLLLPVLQRPDLDFLSIVRPAGPELAGLGVAVSFSLAALSPPLRVLGSALGIVLCLALWILSYSAVNYLPASDTAAGSTPSGQSVPTKHAWRVWAALGLGVASYVWALVRLLG
jgi:hypothetical protein